MNTLLWLGLALIGLAVLIAVSIYLLRTRVVIVPEGQQIVVFQLGRFNRVAGPGPVVLNRALDTVERTINVRDEPSNHRVDGLFANGLPFGYTLNFWQRTDLNAAAGGDREQLRQMALFDDNERRIQVNTILRKVLVQTLANLDGKYPLRDGAGLVHKLLPLLPGLPRCDEMLMLLQNELQRTLPSVGVIVDMHQPIVVQAVHLGSDIVDSFSRGRKVEFLRKQWPELTEEMLLQAFSVIEGLEHLPQSHFVLDTGAATATQVEVRTDDDEIKPRVKMRQENPRAEAPPIPERRPKSAQAPGEESLSAEDLGVLKSVPPYNEARRAAG